MTAWRRLLTGFLESQVVGINDLGLQGNGLQDLGRGLGESHVARESHVSEMERRDPEGGSQRCHSLVTRLFIHLLMGHSLSAWWGGRRRTRGPSQISWFGGSRF